MVRSNGQRLLRSLTRNLLHESRFPISCKTVRSFVTGPGHSFRICGNFAPKNVTDPINWLLLGILNGNLGATKSIHGTASITSVDYYEILGVKKNATTTQIKKAYNELAKKYYPDANKEDPKVEEKFLEVQKAYAFLEDKQIREVYDQVGHEALVVNPDTSAGSDPFHDNFDFKKIIFQKRMIEQNVKTEPCKACAGVGIPLAVKRKECKFCQGDGIIHIQPSTRVDISKTCEWCRGLGYVLSGVCKTCKGGRVARRKKTVQLDNMPVSNPRNLLLLGILNGYLAAPRSIHGTASVSSRNYYDILGVKVTATAAEIKNAYYGLVKKFHPDVNKEDPKTEKKFQEVQNAYEVLKDDYTQHVYDQVGHEAYVNHETNGCPGFFEIFMFRNWMDGDDVEVDMEISFMEAVQGCTKIVTFQTELLCEACDGSGYPTLRVKLEKCKCCMGEGMVYKQVGLMTIGKTCARCRGGGYSLCKACEGRRVTRGTKTVQLDIVPGVDNNETLKVFGGGGAPLYGVFKYGKADFMINDCMLLSRLEKKTPFFEERVLTFM